MHLWRGHEELRAHAVELEAALTAAGAQVSAHWPAIEVWLDHHRDEQPWAVAIEECGRWVAVAVLSVRQRRGIGSVRSATEPGTAAALAAKNWSAGVLLADALARELARERRPWVMRLGLLPDVDPAAQALRERLKYAELTPAQSMPQLLFTPGSDLRNHLSRNTRSSVARARNRLLRQRCSQPELTWLTSPAQAQAVLGELLDLHRRRNRQLRGEAALDDPEAAGYFEDMVIGHAERRRLELLTARVDGVLAAFAVCLTAGSTAWVYANLVAPEWTEFSLGTIANAEVVRRFHAEPAIDCLDWGAGLQRYKLSGGAVVMKTQLLESWSSWPLRVRTQIRRLPPSRNVVS